MNSNILSSWKEISAYTGFTERTLQRWEQRFGFPVRRPAGKPRSAVSALITEIEAWLSTAPSLPAIQQTFARYPGKHSRKIAPSNQRDELVGQAGEASPPLSSTDVEQRWARRAMLDDEKALELTDLLHSGVSLMKLLRKEQVRRRVELANLRAEFAKTREVTAHLQRKMNPVRSILSSTRVK